MVPCPQSQHVRARLHNGRTAFSMTTRDFRVETSKPRAQRTSAASTSSLDMCLAFSGGLFKEVSLFLHHHHSTGGLNMINFPPLVNRSVKPQMVSWGVTFAPLSKVWKVILFFPPDGYENKDKDEFHIITVGVNDETWRVVEFEAKITMNLIIRYPQIIHRARPPLVEPYPRLPFPAPMQQTDPTRMQASAAIHYIIPT
ncbi:F-box family protein [Striga asiatica]|uniref:F-box family protein n=1 Tax=Striga asiatica TaxID=4170 RepID=A0A5A7P9M3_STRAF|nr:F-box family protein [Striga asiatica]